MGNFYTDVIQKAAVFASKDRVSDANLLEPVTRHGVQSIIEDAATHGIKLMVFETFRSRQRQALLFERGASKLRKVGVHHYGLACDIVKDVAGEPSWKGDFSFLGVFAKRNALIWGGDWGEPGSRHSFIDADHVQRCTVWRQADLFSGAWYPSGDYAPYNDNP
ncbi:M15 family metallopeptidase [Mesorhizobium sp. M0571]|uniref:M15 family metallopeptidase n=1 Tax=Mesorhizobium sp. M0571 TaxID=2956960 RepID=UPI0033353CB7